MPVVKSDLSDVSKPAKDVLVLFFASILAEVIGVWLAISEAPSTTNLGFGDVETTGSQGASIFGLVLAAAGSMASLVALVAWGTVLGMKMRDAHRMQSQDVG